MISKFRECSNRSAIEFLYYVNFLQGKKSVVQGPLPLIFKEDSHGINVCPDQLPIFLLIGCSKSLPPLFFIYPLDKKILNSRFGLLQLSFSLLPNGNPKAPLQYSLTTFRCFQEIAGQRAFHCLLKYFQYQFQIKEGSQ